MNQVMRNYQRTNTMQNILIGILGFVALAGFITWQGHRDELMMQAVERYEDCVEREYRTTPAAWYIEHGEYPTCDPSN